MYDDIAISGQYPSPWHVGGVTQEFPLTLQASQSKTFSSPIFTKLVSFFPTDPHALNSYGWRMSELEINLEDALVKTQLAVSLSNDNPQSKANILDTEAEILWKLGKIQEAIDVIDKAIQINPEKQYFTDQKNKFLDSL